MHHVIVVPTDYPIPYSAQTQCFHVSISIAGFQIKHHTTPRHSNCAYIQLIIDHLLFRRSPLTHSKGSVSSSHNNHMSSPLHGFFFNTLGSHDASAISSSADTESFWEPYHSHHQYVILSDAGLLTYFWVSFEAGFRDITRNSPSFPQTHTLIRDDSEWWRVTCTIIQLRVIIGVPPLPHAGRCDLFIFGIFFFFFFFLLLSTTVG